MLTETEKRRIWERAYDAGASRPYDVLHAMEHLLWYWYAAPDDTREDTAIRQAVFALGETRQDLDIAELRQKLIWENEVLTYDTWLEPPTPPRPSHSPYPFDSWGNPV